MYCWSNREKKQTLKSEPLRKQKDSHLLQSLSTRFRSAFALAKLWRTGFVDLNYWKQKRGFEWQQVSLRPQKTFWNSEHKSLNRHSWEMNILLPQKPSGFPIKTLNWSPVVVIWCWWQRFTCQGAEKQFSKHDHKHLNSSGLVLASSKRQAGQQTGGKCSQSTNLFQLLPDSWPGLSQYSWTFPFGCGWRVKARQFGEGSESNTVI